MLATAEEVPVVFAKIVLVGALLVAAGMGILMRVRAWLKRTRDKRA